MGDWFNIIATAILIAKLTNSGLAVGALFVIRALAQFVTGPFGGVLADRFNRKRILIWADVLRCLIVLGFLLVKDTSHIWLLYTLTALQLGISGIFFPTKDAILPDVVVEEEIGTANALTASTWSTMLALGAFLGGQVTGAWGIAPAIVLDAASYLLSAWFIARMTYTQTTVKSETAFTPTAHLSTIFSRSGLFIETQSHFHHRRAEGLADAGCFGIQRRAASGAFQQGVCGGGRGQHRPGMAVRHRGSRDRGQPDRWLAG